MTFYRTSHCPLPLALALATLSTIRLKQMRRRKQAHVDTWVVDGAPFPEVNGRLARPSRRFDLKIYSSFFSGMHAIRDFEYDKGLRIAVPVRVVFSVFPQNDNSGFYGRGKRKWFFRTMSANSSCTLHVHSGRGGRKMVFSDSVLRNSDWRN